MGFCPCQLVTDLLQGNWCNVFWPLAANALNQLGQYTNSPGWPNVMQNLSFSSLVVAVTITSTHFAYPWRDDQAQLI